MEAFQEAREKGLVRFLGITGHGWQAPAAHLKALERADLDTVMVTLNPQMMSLPHYRRDMEALLRVCQERDVGVHILKAVAKGPWGEQPRTHTTWYEPLAAQEDVQRAVNYVLSHPVTTLCSAGDAKLLPKILEAGEHFTRLTPEQVQEIERQATAQLQPIFT